MEQLNSVYKHVMNRFIFIRIQEKVGERERERETPLKLSG